MSKDDRSSDRPVLILSNSLCGGGAEAVARLMSEKIRNASCVLFENDAGIVVPGRRVRAAYRQYRAGWFFTALVNLWRLAFIQWEKIVLRPRLTISHLEGPNYSNMLTILGGRRVLFVHNRISQSYPSNATRERLKRYLCKTLYPRADKVIAISRGVSRELTQSLRIDPDKVLILPNPIDRKAIDRAATERYGDYRDNFSGQGYLVSVASLTAQKNHDLMLRVYQQLISRSSNCSMLKLILLGDGSLRDELQNLCEKLGLRVFDSRKDQFRDTAHVYFLGFQENPYPITKQAQLLLMTSRWEGLPIALLEAMSFGVPGIVSDCSEGIRDAWKVPTETSNPADGALGLETAYGVLIPPAVDHSGSITYWVNAIERLLADPARRARCAEACRRRATDFDIDQVADTWSRQLLDGEGS